MSLLDCTAAPFWFYFNVTYLENRFLIWLENYESLGIANVIWEGLFKFLWLVCFISVSGIWSSPTGCGQQPMPRGFYSSFIRLFKSSKLGSLLFLYSVVTSMHVRVTQKISDWDFSGFRFTRPFPQRINNSLMTILTVFKQIVLMHICQILIVGLFFFSFVRQTWSDDSETPQRKDIYWFCETKFEKRPFTANLLSNKHFL